MNKVRRFAELGATTLLTVVDDGEWELEEEEEEAEEEEELSAEIWYFEKGQIL